MDLVNVGRYLCGEMVLMEVNLAKTLIKYLDEAFIISKLKNGYILCGETWDDELNKAETFIEFYEGSDEYGGVNFLTDLVFYTDDKNFCDTIKLFADCGELLEYGFNSGKEENRIKESVTINSEEDLKRALEFVIKKI